MHISFASFFSFRPVNTEHKYNCSNRAPQYHKISRFVPKRGQTILRCHKAQLYILIVMVNEYNQVLWQSQHCLASFRKQINTITLGDLGTLQFVNKISDDHDYGNCGYIH